MTTRNDRIRAIQASRRKVAGLEDEATWRGFLARASGGPSSIRAMDDGQLAVVLRALSAQGAKRQGPARAGRRPLARGPEAEKIRALWLSAWHLGVVSDPSEAALGAFALRQTKVEALQWLDSAGASKVIEGLKAMLARPVEKKGGGVDWRAYPATGEGRKLAVLAAQVAILGQPLKVLLADAGADDLDGMVARLGPLVRVARGLDA